jgi:quercetin dioxygenase-like cupin family protein
MSEKKQSALDSTPDGTTTHRRAHPQPMAAEYLEFDLEYEVEQLHREREWTTGQNAKTLVKYEDLRVVLAALRAQARIPSHHADGRVTIQTVRGHIHVRAAGRTFDLPAGRVLALEAGLEHEVEAVEDSALLLTIAWHKA